MPIRHGADKAYDVRSFTADLRRMCVTPHIARNDTIDRHGWQRSSSITARAASPSPWCTYNLIRMPRLVVEVP